MNTSKLVENYLSKKPIIKNLLAKGLINKNKLALNIIESHDNTIFQTPKLNTVLVSISRYQKKLLDYNSSNENTEYKIRSRYPVSLNYLEFESMTDSLQFVGDVEIDDNIILLMRGRAVSIIGDIDLSLELIETPISHKSFNNLCEITVDYKIKELSEVGLLYKVLSAFYWDHKAVVNIQTLGQTLYIHVHEENISEIIQLLRENLDISI